MVKITCYDCRFSHVCVVVRELPGQQNNKNSSRHGGASQHVNIDVMPMDRVSASSNFT